MENCRVCHADLVAVFESAERSHLHAEGQCLACHGVHATDFDGHLIAPVEDLCVSCHDEIRVKLDEAVSHDAVFKGERCLTCHEPHASNQPMMLRDELATICLECHSKEVQALDGRTIPGMSDELTGKDHEHGPVEMSECHACHDIHGAGHARLLKRAAPGANLGKFDIRSYGLCLECHPQALVLEEKTTIVTEFRDGDVNLHSVHLKEERSPRSCTKCHAAHGSDLPRHMARFGVFEGSNWKVPVGFVLTEDGGKCAPGCHEPLAYSRDNPIGARLSDPKGEGR